MNSKFKNKLVTFGYPVLQFAVILTVGIFTGEVWYTIVTAALGVLYTYLTARGIKYGFCVAWVYVLLYAYTSFTERLYATGVFLAVFLFPMMIASFISWGKNTADKDVRVRTLNAKRRIFLACGAAAFVAALTVVLYFVSGAQPFTDAMFFAVSAIAAVLILLRYCEMWWMSVFSCLVGCVMWSGTIAQGSTQWSILLLNLFSLLNSILGIIKWTRMNRQQATDGRNISL